MDGEDTSLIVRREIAAAGKGRVFINNQPATVAVLRQLAGHLGTIHAQNESIVHFDAAARQGLLDAYGGVELDDVATAFSGWKHMHDRIADLEQNEQDRMRMLDLWKFQSREIEEARLAAGEDERLEAEKRVLANAEKIYGAAINAFDLLYEGNASTSSSLRAAQKHLEELARYEPKFKRRWPRWNRHASAWRMWERRSAIMPEEFRLLRSGWRKSKSGWRCWTG